MRWRLDNLPVDPPRVGLVIRTLRIRRNWRQADLARMADVLQTTISRIERDRGWVPAQVGAWLLVAERSSNRERVRAHQAVLGAAYPAGSLEMRRWLREPAGPIRARFLRGWRRQRPRKGANERDGPAAARCRRWARGLYPAHESSGDCAVADRPDVADIRRSVNAALRVRVGRGAPAALGTWHGGPSAVIRAGARRPETRVKAFTTSCPPTSSSGPARVVGWRFFPPTQRAERTSWASAKESTRCRH